MATLTTDSGTVTNLGTVRSETRSKDAQLFQQPMPGQDSSNALVLDVFGVTGEIKIKGDYTSDEGSISTFIAFLNGLVGGSQKQKHYVSDKWNPIVGYYGVYIQDVNISAEEAGVNKVNYEISMIEAQSIS